jgi:putative ATP-dependent DNA ligase
MIGRDLFERVDSTADRPGELFEHVEQRAFEGRTYYALPDARHGIERGTAFFPDEAVVVRGYPSVPRVLVLDPGIESFFGPGDGVVIEEKLDGFNVRVADVGEPLAFTRSGYVCPYTTARTRALLDLTGFFADHPDKMLCAELIGPETPYATHDYDDVDSHAVRVFGIRDRASGDPVPVSERRDLCSRYGFTQPRQFGRYDPADAPDAVEGAIRELDAAGREGVLLKSADSESMVKYTTETQHHRELADAFSLPFDYGRDFLFSRVVREAFQAAELDEDDDRRRERARDLGESILLPMVETIEAVADDRAVGERHTVRGDPETVAALLDHLRDQSLTLEVDRDDCESGSRVVTFRKVAESTQDRIAYYLRGGTRDE